MEWMPFLLILDQLQFQQKSVSCLDMLAQKCQILKVAELQSKVGGSLWPKLSLMKSLLLGFAIQLIKNVKYLNWGKSILKRKLNSSSDRIYILENGIVIFAKPMSKLLKPYSLTMPRLQRLFKPWVVPFFVKIPTLAWTRNKWLDVHLMSKPSYRQL